MDPLSTPAVALRQLWVPLAVLYQVWLLAFPIWTARTRGVNVLRLPRPWAVFVDALLAVLVLPAVVVSSIVVFNIVDHLFGPTVSPTNPWSEVTGPLTPSRWVIFIVLAVAVAPVTEEAFYRGLFYNALRKRLHPILAATIQGVVFGLLHPLGLANSAAIAMAGLTLALVYKWRKALLTPVFLHAAVNSLGLVFMAPRLAADAAAPRLGVYGDAYEGGCRLTEVKHGSAAETAGLQIGDVITAVDRQPIADIRSLAQVVRKHQVGDTVSVEFRRGREVHRIDVILTRLKE